MATYYVGIGGNDGNSGLTWALRKLTLNGAEDVPVVAGDTVYVGPGVYREELTVDVSGGAGTEIVYIGDVTGEYTDGVGGIVRITGSDNDQTAVRGQCVSASGFDYRIFRGFFTDSGSSYGINVIDVENWTVEDCAFFHHGDAGVARNNGTGSLNITIRRCVFVGNQTRSVLFYDADLEDDENHLVENCLMVASATQGQGVVSYRVGGITVRNCTIIGTYRCVQVGAALTVGQTVTVNNCTLTDSYGGVHAQVLGEIVEDYNNFFNNGTDRTNVNIGANSVSYIPGLCPPLLHAGASQVSGYKFPWWFGELSEWSQVRAITGSNEPTEDLRGIVRPTTAAKNSWGAVQFHDIERDTGTVYDGVASLKLADAGRHQVFVPVNPTSLTITVQVYREVDYAGGNNPQMIVKQPGQADDITTDAAAASQWNELTTQLAPSPTTDFVVVELVSRNTAAAGSYATYFNNLVVT